MFHLTFSQITDIILISDFSNFCYIPHRKKILTVFESIFKADFTQTENCSNSSTEIYFYFCLEEYWILVCGLIRSSSHNCRYIKWKYNQTPSRKRKKTTTARWEFLTQECNLFHSRDPQSQKDTLILYLIKCADRSEPSEKLEIDPRKDR